MAVGISPYFSYCRFHSTGDFPDGDTQSPMPRGIGSAERGVLRPRKNPSTPSPICTDTPTKQTYRRITTQCDSPLDQLQTTTPICGAANKWVGPTSSFPLSTWESQDEDTSASEDLAPISNFLHSKGLRARLSTFEEESESETSIQTGGGSSRASPVPTLYRPSAILNTPSPTMRERSSSIDRVRSVQRKSPSMKKQNSFSRSDGSDDAESEEDDEIVELLTASGNYSKTLSMLRKRLERGSPHLSRKSPTYCWTGSSDEEGTSKLDDKHKRRTKQRMHARAKNRIRRVDSASSDDGSVEPSRVSLLKHKFPINVTAKNAENSRRYSHDDTGDTNADVLRELMELKSLAKKIELSDDEFDADNYSISETDSKTDLSKTDLLQCLDPMQAIRELPSPQPTPFADISHSKECNGRVLTPSVVSLHVTDHPANQQPMHTMANKNESIRTRVCDVL